jgi:hypothetical protein
MESLSTRDSAETAVKRRYALAAQAPEVALRHPRETKGQEDNVTTSASRCYDGGNGG